MYRINTRNRCCCRPVVTDVTPVCGVEVVLDSDVYCTRVCNIITFTATVINNTNMTLNCVSLDLNVNPSLCINPETITLNGITIENACPDRVDIGNLEAGASAIVTFQATVMECKRYIKSKVFASYLVCCCLERKCVTTPSNIDCIQVCCCCCSPGTTRS